MHNKTFEPGPNPSLNAVVGKGWSFDKNHAYMTGFDQAVEVLLSAAMNESFVDPETGDAKAVYIDALVYPICFCARHFIELFLKRQIAQISTLRGGPYEDAAGTHDLADLWERLRRLVPLDRRLAPVADKLDEVITDFAVIDASGETFRYAYDLEKNPHLNDKSHINIGLLSTRLTDLREHAENFELLVEFLRDEYRQLTYTSKLSREDIEKIARLLPSYNTWKSGTIKTVKSELLQHFNISNNDFARAVCIIKRHREFSSHIDVEIPLAEVTTDLVETLKCVQNEKTGYQLVTEVQWAALAAISEIGRLDVYSESYDALITLHLQEDYEGRITPSDVMREILGKHNRFRTGLRKLGQSTLLSKFDAEFPEPPSEPVLSPEAQMTQFRKLLKLGRPQAGEEQPSSQVDKGS